MSRVSFGLPAELQDYVVKVGTRPNPHRAALRDATNALENASMQISEEQGNFMYLLIKMLGARKCLEVGTFTGYSALVTAEAVAWAALGAVAVGARKLSRVSGHWFV